jgi:arylsulfatase A-like enzyme
MPEDMTIPVFVYGKGIETGNTLGNISIKDIAPTVVKLLGVEPDEDWEGKSFI